jgi:predicted ribosome quality control (RQC) complex YloA/Tae2 family protein
MDNAVLTPLTCELEAALTGATLGDVVQIDSNRFVFRFSTSPFRRLVADLHPEISAPTLIRRAPRDAAQTELTSVLTASLQNMTLTGIAKEPGERVLEMRFEAEGQESRTVVLEMMGRASNLLLLNSQGEVVRFLKSHKGAFRQPAEGKVYEPPRRRDDTEALPLGSRLARLELEALILQGEDESRSRQALADRISSGPWEPRIYSSKPLDTIKEHEPVSAESCFPAPFSLISASRFTATSHETLNEAVCRWAELLRRHLHFRDLHGSLSQLIRGETKRLEKLISKLNSEAETARGAGEVRRWGELILASLSPAGTAVKKGSHVELADIFQPNTPLVRIEVNPRLDLKTNAEVFFKKARKLERAVDAVAGRLAESTGKLDALREFEQRFSRSESFAELEEFESELNRSSLVRSARVVRKPGRKEAGRKPTFMRLRELELSGGYRAIIGKSGADNDTVTFKLANPHDFWLHAAGRPGAHVIVRNPKRERSLPEKTLEEAAAIAAWFSKGDRKTEVEVHHTRRKEVKKGKGMSPGMVMLRNYQSIRVKPGLPDKAGKE